MQTGRKGYGCWWHYLLPPQKGHEITWLLLKLTVVRRESLPENNDKIKSSPSKQYDTRSLTCRLIVTNKSLILTNPWPLHPIVFYRLNRKIKQENILGQRKIETEFVGEILKVLDPLPNINQFWFSRWSATWVFKWSITHMVDINTHVGDSMKFLLSIRSVGWDGFLRQDFYLLEKYLGPN